MTIELYTKTTFKGAKRMITCPKMWKKGNSPKITSFPAS